jgi:hypothetical protein
MNYEVSYVNGSRWEVPQRLALPSGVKVETTIAPSAVQAVANVETENPEAFQLIEAKQIGRNLDAKA